MPSEWKSFMYPYIQIKKKMKGKFKSVFWVCFSFSVPYQDGYQDFQSISMNFKYRFLYMTRSYASLPWTYNICSALPATETSHKNAFLREVGCNTIWGPIIKGGAHQIFFFSLSPCLQSQGWGSGDFWPAGSGTFFLLDPDPTCNNGFIKLFSSWTKYKPELTNSSYKWWFIRSSFMPAYLKYIFFFFISL